MTWLWTDLALVLGQVFVACFLLAIPIVIWGWLYELRTYRRVDRLPADHPLIHTDPHHHDRQEQGDHDE